MIDEVQIYAMCADEAEREHEDRKQRLAKRNRRKLGKLEVGQRLAALKARYEALEGERMPRATRRRKQIIVLTEALRVLGIVPRHNAPPAWTID